MKNFYEVTVIDLINKLNVVVELVEQDNPKYVFTVNNFSVINNATLSFNLFDQLDFTCQVYHGAVEIKKIAVNDKEIMPVYLYLSKPQTSWVTQNWHLTIPGPFYPWYHEITGQGWIA